MGFNFEIGEEKEVETRLAASLAATIIHLREDIK
jgi:hypothetical protein